MKKENENKKAVKTPLEHGMKTCDEILDDHEKVLTEMNFMAKRTINLGADVIVPNQNKFLVEKFNRVFIASFLPNGNEKNHSIGKLTLTLGANFVIKSVCKVCKKYNNKSNEKDEIYYILDLKSDNSIELKDVEITGHAKSDYKEFQRILSTQGNNFMVKFNESEFKSFVQTFIIPRLDKTITIFTNCGIIAPNTFLYENALAVKGKIAYADENGLINVGLNNYVKADDTVRTPKPLLTRTDKEVRVIADEFLRNMCDCWGTNLIYAFLAVGHMIMAVYYNEFINGIGIPTLLISGASSSGKSTLVKIGLAFFGLDNKFLCAGNSTAYSHQFFLNLYNGMNICVDDLQEKIICSQNFNAVLKNAYNGQTRFRGNKDVRKGLDGMSMCSQLVYSTNNALPPLPELESRAIILNVMKNTLDTSKFEYFEDKDGNRNKNLDELSRILPEILKIDIGEVRKMYDENFARIQKEAPELIERIINNIAYAYTGYKLLEKIAQVNVSEVEGQMIAFAKDVSEHFKQLPTPVDMLLSSIIVLTQNNVIEINKHIRFTRQADIVETKKCYMYFHKETLLSAYNKYFCTEPERKISRSMFDNYFKCDPRRLDKNITMRFEETNSKTLIKNAVGIDITEIPELLGLAEVSEENIRMLEEQKKARNKCNTW